MVKVSVIVPVYNVARFLTQCIDSLVNQTLKDIEIICVNDGSTDDSLKILQKYADADSRVKVLNQNNMGVGGARNTGLAFANGEYIGFVDPDDWVDLDWYEKLYSTALGTGADIVRATTMMEFPDGSQQECEFNNLLRDCVHNKRNLGKNEHFVVIWNGIYKRQLLFENHLNFMIGFVHEDVPFQTKTFYYADKIVPFTGVMYHYRQHRPGRLSETNLRSIHGTFYINHYVLDFINMVEYKNRKDYLDAVSLCIWRADNKFIYGVKNIKDFSPDMQKKYFDMWRNDLSRCKNRLRLKVRYHWLGAVLSGNMKKYIRIRLEKDLMHRIKKLLKPKKSED